MLVGWHGDPEALAVARLIVGRRRRRREGGRRCAAAAVLFELVVACVQALAAGTGSGRNVSTATSIEWTETTWNPTSGCDRVSPGCDHCHALTLGEPFGWKAPRRVFVNSMSDLPARQGHDHLPRPGLGGHGADAAAHLPDPHQAARTLRARPRRPLPLRQGAPARHRLPPPGRRAHPPAGPQPPPPGRCTRPLATGERVAWHLDRYVERGPMRRCWPAVLRRGHVRRAAGTWQHAAPAAGS